MTAQEDAIKEILDQNKFPQYFVSQLWQLETYIVLHLLTSFCRGSCWCC